jgi:hypothetical protein
VCWNFSETLLLNFSCKDFNVIKKLLKPKEVAETIEEKQKE